MNLLNHALVLEMAEQLHANGSWTGKTHVQKALFLLQSTRGEVLSDTCGAGAPPQTDGPFKFVLYRHGPYSFEVERTIEEMCSYGALEIEPMNGYGVALWSSENAAFVQKQAPLPPDVKAAVAEICQFVGSNDVKTLERWATATWIRKREQITEPNQVANRLHELKPHISIPEALAADQAIQPLLR